MSEAGHRTSNGNWSVMSEKALSKNFPLHRACRDGDVDGLALLLHQEAARTHLTLEDTYYGWTPSHWAAYFGKLECLRVLVGGGEAGLASPALTTSRFTQTPAHIAAFAGHPHCLTWLLQAGAHPDAQDYLGETALHKAARTGSLECVNLLLASRAKISVCNNNGQTAGQLADACSYTELTSHLTNLTQKEGMENSGGSSSIARSVPAHGLNGGVFPHCPSSALVTNNLIMPNTNGSTSHSNGTPSHGNETVSNGSGTAPHGNGIAVNGNGTAILTSGTVTHTSGMADGGLLSSPASNGKGPFTNGVSNGPCTSSNGYYGFHPTSAPMNAHQNGQGNGTLNRLSDQSEDMDMETDTDPASDGQNGMTNNHTNTVVATNGIHAVSQSHTNGTTPTFTNEQASRPFLGFTNSSMLKMENGTSNGTAPQSSMSNGSNVSQNGQNHMGEDITLNLGVSQNYIPVGGRKRSREEGFIPEMKRMRTEDVRGTHGWSGEGCKVSGTGLAMAESSSSMVDHASSVKAETGYDCVNMEVLIAQMHGS